MRKYFIIAGLLVFVIGFVFVKGNIASKKSEEKNEEENLTDVDLDKTEENNVLLKVSDNPNLEDNISNTSLYMMHIVVNSISGNGTFDNGGKPFTDSDVIEMLGTIKVDSALVKFGKTEDTFDKDQLNKFNESKELLTQLIDENIKKDDIRLKELHDLIHDLDSYYNGERKAEDTKVNEIGDPIN